jgi:hypothetical protein
MNSMVSALQRLIAGRMAIHAARMGQHLSEFAEDRSRALRPIAMPWNADGDLSSCGAGVWAAAVDRVTTRMLESNARGDRMTALSMIEKAMTRKRSWFPPRSRQQQGGP